MNSRASVSSVPIFALLTIAAVLLANTCDACAQELPDISAECAPDVTTGRRATVLHEGQTGIWFHGDVARCMVGRLAALPLYAERVRLLDQRLQITGARDALRTRQVALAEEGEQRAVSALQAAVRARRSAEEALDAWWRHPGFWAAVGAVVVVGLEVLAVWAFSEVTR